MKRGSFSMPVWRTLARQAPLFSLLALVSCAFPFDRQSPHFQADNAERVFTAGYEYIDDRYIESVSIGDLSVSGLGRLSQIDQEIAVSRKGDTIELVMAGESIETFPAPEDDRPEDWAEVSVRVIESGREKSTPLRQANAETFYKTVFIGMVEELDDYSRYATAEEARRNRASREGFGGIGIQILVENDLVTVVSVLPNTPAEEADLQPDDHITHIDDKSIKGLAIREVVDLLRGKIGTSVTVTILRDGEDKPFPFTLNRKLIVGLTVNAKIMDDIGYMRVTSFNKRTAESMRKTLEEFQPMIEEGAIKGLIFDLRSNPGGLLDQAVDVTSLFLDEGRVVFTKGRHPDSSQSFDADGEDMTSGIPIIVLINGNSASASEIVAAALQDHGRAVVVGSSSYGKGTVQNVITLPNDGELTLTWSRFHAPSGYSLQGLGVLPTICTSGLTDLESPGESGEESVRESTGDGTLSSALFGGLHAKFMESEAVVAEWRATTLPDQDAIERLRAFCPPEKKTNDEDLELAKRLISNPALYQRAQSLSFPNLANR